MIRKAIFTLLLFLTLINTFSQKGLIKVPLQTFISNEKFGTSTSPISIRKKGDYKGIPHNLENYLLGHIVFQKKQYYFNEYNKGDIPKERYATLVKTYKLDTIDVSKEEVKCYIGVLSYITGTKKTIIADSNNDHDFSNDNIYVYDSNSSIKSFEGVNLSFLPTLHVNYEIFKNGKRITKNSYLKLKPFDHSYKYKDTLLQKQQVFAVTYQYTIGSFKFDDKDYKILVDNIGSGFEEDNRNPSFNLQLENRDFKFTENIKKNEVVKIDGHEFKITECTFSQDTVTLEYLGFNKTVTGWQTGDHLPLTRVNDMKGNSIDLMHLLKTNDFLLIDFWGSWCAPCIKELPKIKEFSLLSNLNKIALVSVAYEMNEKGKERALERITEFQMNWPQIIEFERIENSIVKTLNIRDYPTLILIDKKGVIIKKEVGSGGMDKISTFLKINTPQN